MNYNRIYASIVLRAQADYGQRRWQQKHGQYYELHHIIPKTLGGVDRLQNRALLTAKEHFICHWLLTKLYPVDSNEYRKMMFAFWRMRSTNDNHRRYINARIYETLRCQFAKVVGYTTAITQRGQRNSHYGTRWYTNYITGESKVFRMPPDAKEWVRGRNLYHGQNTSIRSKIFAYAKQKGQPCGKICAANASSGINTVSGRMTKRPRIELHNAAIQRARELWDRYHSGNYSKLEDFSNELKISKVALYYTFKKFIPKYLSDKTVGKRTHYPSDLSLVSVYT